MLPRVVREKVLFLEQREVAEQGEAAVERLVVPAVVLLRAAVQAVVRVLLRVMFLLVVVPVAEARAVVLEAQERAVLLQLAETEAALAVVQHLAQLVPAQWVLQLSLAPKPMVLVEVLQLSLLAQNGFFFVRHPGAGEHPDFRLAVSHVQQSRHAPRLHLCF